MSTFNSTVKLIHRCLPNLFRHELYHFYTALIKTYLDHNFKKDPQNVNRELHLVNFFRFSISLITSQSAIENANLKNSDNTVTRSFCNENSLQAKISKIKLFLTYHHRGLQFSLFFYLLVKCFQNSGSGEKYNMYYVWFLLCGRSMCAHASRTEARRRRS